MAHRRRMSGAGPRREDDSNATIRLLGWHMDSSFRVRGRSDRFDETDPAWLDQHAELFGTMTHLGVTVGRESADGSESKGALDTIVVTITAPGELKLCAEAW